jgi:hypothetical protein
MASCAFLKNVPNATKRVNELGFKRVIDLRAQAPDGYIDDVGVTVEIHVPDQRDDLGASQRFARSAHEQVQKRKFLGGEIDACATAEDAMADGVEFQIGNFQRALLD